MPIPPTFPALRSMQPQSSAQLYFRLLSYLRGARRHVAVALITLILTAATEPLLPALMKPLVDNSLIARDAQSILYIPLALLAVFTIRGVADYFSRISTEAIAQCSIEKIRNQMFSSVTMMPIADFDRIGSGRLLSRFTFDTNQITEALSNAWVVLIRDSLTVLALLAYLFYLSWQLTLILLLITPVAAYIINRASTAMRAFSTAAQESMGALTHVLEENIEGHSDVKMFNAESLEKKRFASAAAAVRQQLLSINRVSALNVPLVQVISAASVSLVLYIAFGMNAQNLITPGTLVAYITAMALLFDPIRRLTHVNPEIQKGLAAAQSLFDLIDARPENDQGTTTKTAIKGSICFENVSFAYPGGSTSALKNIHLHIAAGESVALVGPSGSGKSTILKLLTRFYAPQYGTIHIDGTDIQDFNLANLRQHIALVSQGVILFNSSVQANIAYGSNAGKPFDGIKGAAENACADDFISTLDRGYDTLIGENGSLLSGGQRQRIALARAFLKKAPILLLDEASSALDSASDQRVQRALQDLSRHCTTIVITHRLSTIKHIDRIIVMHAGSIVEEGRHEQLIKHDGLYADLYRQGEFKND